MHFGGGNYEGNFVEMERIGNFVLAESVKKPKGSLSWVSYHNNFIYNRYCFFSSNTRFVPLYNNLTIQEVGQIKAELDTRGIPYELNNGGTSINVPEEQVESLLVDLAGMGLPNSGNIDYSFLVRIHLGE